MPTVTPTVMPKMAKVICEPAIGNDALAEIAALFQAEWKRLRTVPTQAPATTLRADLLTVVLPHALTDGERRQSATKAGRRAILQQLDEWINSAYPKLATGIEARLHCYVTWSDIAIAPDNSSVNVRIGLRNVPRYTAISATAEACGAVAG